MVNFKTGMSLENAAKKVKNGGVHLDRFDLEAEREGGAIRSNNQFRNNVKGKRMANLGPTRVQLAYN